MDPWCNIGPMDITVEPATWAVEKIATQKSIQVEVDQMLERTPDPEIQRLISTGLRTRLIDELQLPYQAILHYLFRHYSGEDGELSPKALKKNPEALALNELRKAYQDLGGALSRIVSASLSLPLSCNKHGSIYAGGVESAGNRIFSPQDLAANGLKATAGRGLNSELKGDLAATPGSISEAAQLLSEQVRIAKSALTTIVGSELSCEHERIQDVPTPAEVALEAQRSIDGLKLTGSPIAD